MTGPPERLTFRTPDGARAEWDVRAEEPPTPAGPGAGRAGAEPVDVIRLIQREGHPEQYIQKKVPLGRLTTEGCAGLFNEIQIGLELARMFDGRYPRELSRLIGYDDQCDQPFLLVEQRGRSVAPPANQALLDDMDQFQVGLLRALSILEAANVVHRSITPKRVLWDGQRVQLVNFRHARFTGEACPAAPGAIWAAPETRRHVCTADPAEDLWSACRVLVHVFEPRHLIGRFGAPDQRALRPALARTVDGVFRDLPSDRPELQVIMRELNYGQAFFSRRELSAISADDPALDLGVARFDEVLEAKRRRRRMS